MSSFERVPAFEETPDFGMELSIDGFDINAAFQEAVHGVASDTELALEEKVRRMEAIVSEGTSEVYRDFVDFRHMASQMEMMCSDDHSLSESILESNTLTSFMDNHREDDGHGHDSGLHGKHSHKDDEYEIDPKTGKKKKKKKYAGWLFF